MRMISLTPTKSWSLFYLKDLGILSRTYADEDVRSCQRLQGPQLTPSVITSPALLCSFKVHSFPVDADHIH